MVLHDVVSQRPAERFDYWRDAICKEFTTLTPDVIDCDTHEFTGCVEVRPLGSVNRAVLGSIRQHVAHGHREVARSDRGVYFVNLQLAGTCHVRTPRGEDEVAPGQLTIVDTATPYWFEYEGPWQVMSFQVPHAELSGDHSEYTVSTGRAIDTTSGIGSVVRSLMTSVWELDDRYVTSGPAGAFVERSFYSTVEAVLGPRRAQIECPSGAISVAAREHIRTHLHDATLSASSVARALAVSTRTLHYAFANGESFSEHVRPARLDAIARALQDPRRDTSISDIANRHGMVDASSFSRAFRSRFSMTPREYRAQWKVGPTATVA